jgi:hypothetical protein
MPTKPGMAPSSSGGKGPGAFGSGVGGSVVIASGAGVRESDEPISVGMGVGFKMSGGED